MIATCPDCDRTVELYRGACPFCGNRSLGVPGGVAPRFAKLPWLKRLKAVKPVVELQRRVAGFGAFWRGR